VLGHWIKEFISPHKKCKHPTSYVYCCQVIEITQKYYEKYEVRGFHRGAEEDSVVLEYDAMSFTEWLLLFHGNSPSLSSPAQTLKTGSKCLQSVNNYWPVSAMSYSKRTEFSLWNYCLLLPVCTVPMALRLMCILQLNFSVWFESSLKILFSGYMNKFKFINLHLFSYYGQG
jgi:hypothetical protein